MSNYAKIKAGFPIQISNKVVRDFEPRSTNLTVESQTDEGVTCYHLVVGNIALASSRDYMKIYVVQNSTSIQDKPFLMTAEKSLDAHLTATFAPGDFK